MARVVVTPSADPDVEHIIDHLDAHTGYRVAARYNASIERLHDHFADFPDSGSPGPKIGMNIRIAIVFPYIVIYRRYEANDLLRVLRVVHGGRRITGRLLRGLS